MRSLKAGYIAYSNRFDVNRIQDPRTVSRQLSSLSLSPGRNTLTEALKRVPTDLFQNLQLSEPKSLVVYALESLPSGAVVEISKLRDQGYKVTLIGVGDEVSEDDLKKPFIDDPQTNSRIDPIIDPRVDDDSVIDKIIDSLLKGMFPRLLFEKKFFL